MATQTRVPGAASSEVDFELERFERAADGRVEVAGRWYGLRGRRFVRPVLNLQADGGRRRLIALLEHKPWAADDGKTWIAAFAWPPGVVDVEGAELEVGPGLAVTLPAPGAGSSAPRVSALRRIPAPAARLEMTPPAPLQSTPLRRDALIASQAEREEASAARDQAERRLTEALGDRDDALSRRDAALRDVDRALGERDEAVIERDRLQSELDRVSHERDVSRAERNRALRALEDLERDRDEAAAARDAARGELSRALPEREHALRERDAEAARADQAEAERDTAFAERKSAVAQRDRARRERDRAMRAVGVEPPADGAGPLPGHDEDLDTPPYSAAGRPGTAGERQRRLGREAGPGPRGRAGPDGETRRDAAPRADAAADGPAGRDAASSAAQDTAAPPAVGAGSLRDAPAAPDAIPVAGPARGVALPSRPLKRIGSAPAGAAPEAKPLLTPVDASQRRRLSRNSRSTPSAPARWAVRLLVMLLLTAVLVVGAVMLLELV